MEMWGGGVMGTCDNG